MLPCAGVDEDWDAWSGSVTPDLDDEDDIAELKEQIIQRRIRRAGKRSRVRDEYLRPIVDAQGIYNRRVAGGAGRGRGVVGMGALDRGV